MSDINFEQYARENLDSVNEGKKLSDQVVKLQELEDQVALKEHELKELKRKVESLKRLMFYKRTLLNIQKNISY